MHQPIRSITKYTAEMLTSSAVKIGGPSSSSSAVSATDTDVPLFPVNTVVEFSGKRNLEKHKHFS